jgi:hypothetical protein
MRSKRAAIRRFSSVCPTADQASFTLCVPADYWQNCAAIASFWFMQPPRHSVPPILFSVVAAGRFRVLGSPMNLEGGAMWARD